jgi:hypothetical protein
MRLLPGLLTAFAAVQSAVGLAVPGNAYDHVKNAYIEEGIRWMEIGFFLIIPDVWTSLETTYTNFTDPVVFLSLPNLAGDTSSEGKSTSLRVNNTLLTYVSNDEKLFTFEAKSLSVNDSYCTTIDNYTPGDLQLNSSFIGWLVVERGKFNISHKAFIIQTDVINRTNVNDSTDPKNSFKSFTQLGICDYGNNCKLDNADIILTMAQLQTTRYDRFLLLRAIGAGKRFVVYVLTPHDSLDDANFLIPSPGENYAWMLFEAGLRVTCVENLVLETYMQQVTYLKLQLFYANTFTVAPAVFGMVQTLLGRDSLGLRAFNIDTSSSNFITQEDKCSDPETQHTTEETAAILVIGRTAMGDTVCGATFNDNQPSAFPTAEPSLEPSAAPSAAPTLLTPTSAPSSAPSLDPSSAPSNAPSLAPSARPSNDPTLRPTGKPVTAAPTFDGYTWCVWITLYDTFGDGWGQDVALRVWSDSANSSDTYLYYLCPNDFGVGTGEPNGTITRTADGGPFEFCVFETETLHFDIVPLNPPVVETWEIYWTIEHFVKFGGSNGTSPHQLFVGDYDTNMTATGMTVDIWEPVDYYNQTCKRCKHPPKAGPKGGPGAKGPGAGGSGAGGPGASGPGAGGSGGPGAGGSGPGAKGPGASGPGPRALHDTAGQNSTMGDTDGMELETAGSSDGAGNGKPAPKPKPHWPFPVTLFDTTGTGFFNSSEAWTLVPLYNADGGVEWYDTRHLPAVLTGPEYIIETIDRLHDIRRNTICGDLLKEDCEERLPDAKYIFRVTGALSKWDTMNNSFWHFCGKHGSSMEELEFKLIGGKCFPGKKITAHEKCYGTNLASFAGLLTVSGASSAALTELDAAVLEADIAEAVSGAAPGVHGGVALDSWVLSGSELAVAFSIQFDPMQYAVDGFHYTQLEALAQGMTASAAAYVSSGTFLSYIQTSLLGLPEGVADTLSASSMVAIGDITYRATGVTYGKAAAAAPVEPASLAAEADLTASAEAAPLLAAFQRSMLLFGAVGAGLVVVAFASVQGMRRLRGAGGRYSGAEQLPTESESDVEAASARAAPRPIDVSERDREMVPNWN